MKRAVTNCNEGYAESMSTQRTTIAARNAAFLVFASRFPNSDFVYSQEFQRTLNEALESAAPHMVAL